MTSFSLLLIGAAIVGLAFDMTLTPLVLVGTALCVLV